MNDAANNAKSPKLAGVVAQFAAPTSLPVLHKSSLSVASAEDLLLLPVCISFSMSTTCLSSGCFKVHQHSRRNRQCCSQLANVDKGNVAQTPLNAAEVTARQTTLQGQCFLRPTACTANGRQMAAKWRPKQMRGS